MPNIRLRLVATAPDGRQPIPLEILVPVTPPTPQTHIYAVVVNGPNQAGWDTDYGGSSDGQPCPQFRINEQSPIATYSPTIDFFICTYDFQPQTGDTWDLLAEPEHVYTDAPYAIPQSGQVQ
jgi:hypothetical protein